jgi:hypothetical protein
VRGFTLLETLIAMCVMSFVFLTLPGFLWVMERIEGENTVRARSLLCAQEKMEELMFDAMRGELSPETGQEVLLAGPYERMERRWKIHSSVRGPSLLRVHAECSCPWKKETVRQELETLMMVME